MYVDCSQNPYDLRPPAETIISALNRKIKEVPATVPVVVVFGEIHPMTAHVVLKQFVLHRLNELRKKNPQNELAKFIMAYEDEYDRLEKNLVKHLGKPIPPKMYGRMYIEDKNSKALLSSILGFCQDEYSYAPVATMNLFAFCYHNDIDVHFVDAALSDNYLSEKDTLTSRVYRERYKGDLSCSYISAGSVTGVAIRNNVMVLRALERAKEREAKIVLLSCGRIHVFGQKATADLPEYPYEDSLVNQFNKLGITTLPVFITQKSDYL